MGFICGAIVSHVVAVVGDQGPFDHNVPELEITVCGADRHLVYVIQLVEIIIDRA